MTASIATPTFSIVIPTRDRADMFERALRSVFAQDIDDFEVIVVNDGSSEPALGAYRAIEQSYGGRLKCHDLVHREKGHGPAYSRNFGAAQARGRYLCFLDDDDLWIDAGHLRRCRDGVAAQAKPVDLYFTDQRAVFHDGRLHPGRLWISGIEQEITAPADTAGNRRITLENLLTATGFAHLNCSVYRRVFYESIGGMDETLRYENDRDIYLRAIDAAELMLYNPAVIAQHHIPDDRKTDNVSTAVNQLEKKLFQLRICDKAIISARQRATRDFARRTKGYTLKHMAEALKTAGREREALFYMREALLVAFSFKWLGYTVVSTVQAMLAANRA